MLRALRARSIRTVSDLKGKRIAIRTLGYPGHFFVAIMAAQVGLDPQTDIEWVTSSEVNPMELFVDGKVDAFLGFPPEPQRAARPPDRSGDPRYGDRPAVVAVPLLHSLR
jgi:ABC-type nitrate/sulfonate/bicarbonate transport system substrate-binding protein